MCGSLRSSQTSSSPSWRLGTTHLLVSICSGPALPGLSTTRSPAADCFKLLGDNCCIHFSPEPFCAAVTGSIQYSPRSIHPDSTEAFQLQKAAMGLTSTNPTHLMAVLQTRRLLPWRWTQYRRLPAKPRRQSSGSSKNNSRSSNEAREPPARRRGKRGSGKAERATEHCRQSSSADLNMLSQKPC